MAKGRESNQSDQPCDVGRHHEGFCDLLDCQTEACSGTRGHRGCGATLFAVFRDSEPWFSLGWKLGASLVLASGSDTSPLLVCVPMLKVCRDLCAWCNSVD